MKRWVAALFTDSVQEPFPQRFITEHLFTSQAGKYQPMPYFTGQVADLTISLVDNGNIFSVYLVWFVLARGCGFSYSCGTLQIFT